MQILFCSCSPILKGMQNVDEDIFNFTWGYSSCFKQGVFALVRISMIPQATYIVLVCYKCAESYVGQIYFLLSNLGIFVLDSGLIHYHGTSTYT